ncbi:hypothetical protein [Streptoalloteichus hindustanus]|uniref:Uncharacterized protein n=1 Tax=Streptoalloteichus hindustanus TaxID=2017 RepID=A0A1M5B1H7_STRHI|nr:hypothetical protein [Streptoalloteichus hindustanus]SHF36042.1 hypothetical protein SAMN05444320_103344 [Streptoalloteichus hindustanus]
MTPDRIPAAAEDANELAGDQRAYRAVSFVDSVGAGGSGVFPVARLPAATSRGIDATGCFDTERRVPAELARASGRLRSPGGGV